MTSWLLNSAVIAAGGYGTYRYEPITWAFLKEILQAMPVQSRIGYPETAQVIKDQTGVSVALSRETSELALGDVAYIVRLRYRVDPMAKGRPTARSLDDWEVGRLTRLL